MYVVRVYSLPKEIVFLAIDVIGFAQVVDGMQLSGDYLVSIFLRDIASQYIQNAATI